MPPGKKAAIGTPSLFTFFAAKAAKPRSTQPAGKRKPETTNASGPPTTNGGAVGRKTNKKPKKEARKVNKSRADATTTRATVSAAPRHEVMVKGWGFGVLGLGFRG